MRSKELEYQEWNYLNEDLLQEIEHKQSELKQIKLTYENETITTSILLDDLNEKIKIKEHQVKLAKEENEKLEEDLELKGKMMTPQMKELEAQALREMEE